ncbi:endonuclease/exonuclease/phosphatase family protein [Streptomyces thermoviolaceus]|uniref:Metal-dependent hydrolase n=1 Tax=Streptomyces thermoviolaceus subsp. thermoviolaceus TaxID=66860 RepID=A0ABX0Z289_STRTL|nr:endonuclease/exonuclease/phosphatase family protein [Streptomyces thermoviolaceus]NJP17378.1 metal-dependent hydrolase [Streptomyces thermoviolaceus subsp. thermoviolaceus]WTD46175.1 endonuclease/exonuclease/phosphatase family protein [Streptomyces thermoviolaceus]
MTRRTSRSVFRAVAAGVLAAAAALGAVRPAVAQDGSPAGGPAGAPAVPLRVATYNIRAGAGEDGVFDLDRTARAIRSLDADVVGLQEVDAHWAERSGFADEARELAARLHMRYFFAPIYDLPPDAGHTERRQFGVAVLSRLPVLGAENHEITRLSTQEPDPVPAPAPGFAEVTVRARGTVVHVYSTHLDYRSDPSVRRAQVDDMLGVLAADRGPKVLLGDFNAEPGAPELAKLWGPLADAAPKAGPTYPASAPVTRIDVVAVSPDVRVASARVADVTASDHRPVVADLRLRHRAG